MADMNIAERFMPQDGHIQIHHRGTRVDIRVGTNADNLWRKPGDAPAGKKFLTAFRAGTWA